jgi:hypothetical protein
MRGEEGLRLLVVMISVTMLSILTPVCGSNNVSAPMIPVSKIYWCQRWTLSAKYIPNSPWSVSSAWKVLPRIGVFHFLHLTYQDGDECLRHWVRNFEKKRKKN